MRKREGREDVKMGKQQREGASDRIMVVRRGKR